MKNQTKLERLKLFLDENGIEYHVPNHAGRYGRSDLYIPRWRIAIKVNREGYKEDAYFFKRHRGYARPIYIRTEDSMAFVREKVQNVLIKAMKETQNRIVRAQRKREREEAEANKGNKKRNDKQGTAGRGG